MSVETAQLREIIAGMNFPEDILLSTLSQVDNPVEHVNKQIKEKKITIGEHQVDINRIAEKANIVSKELDRRVDPQLIKISQEFESMQMSPRVPGKKRKQEIADIISRRNKFIEEFQDKTVEAEKFIKDITVQTKSLEDKLKRKKAKEMKKIEEQKALKKQMDEDRIKQLEEEKEDKRKKLEKYQEDLKSKKEEREKIINEKVTKADNYIYKKYQLKEEEAKKEKEEQYKQIKQEIKQMHKPIDSILIKEHEKKYLITKKMKEIEREKSLNGEKVRTKETIKELSKYKSAGEEKFAEQIKEARQLFLKDKEDRTKKLNKMKKVAELMQDLHKPQASEKKRQELLAQMETLHTKPRTHHQLKSANFSPRDNMTDAETIGISNDVKRYPWRTNMSENPKKPEEVKLPEIKTKISYINYLDQIKKERKPNEAGRSIQNILKQEGMTKKEKYDRVRAQVEMMEVKALRKEKLMAACKKPDHKNFEEASDMFINAIRAKLTLLDEI